MYYSIIKFTIFSLITKLVIIIKVLIVKLFTNVIIKYGIFLNLRNFYIHILYFAIFTISMGVHF